MSDNTTTTVQKPQNEIVIEFKRTDDGSIVIGFFDVHGAEMKAEAKKIGLPVKAYGEKAAEFAGKIGELVQALGLQRHGFQTSTKRQYYSYRAVVNG